MILANTKYNNNEHKKDMISPFFVDAAEGDYTYAHDLNTLKVHGKIDYWMYIRLPRVCDPLRSLTRECIGKMFRMLMSY